MGELGKSQTGEAASSLAALAQCCAALAASSGAKASAMQASVDVPMRDLVRSLQGVRGALAARHAAHTTHLATLQELEGKRLKLAKLRCALFSLLALKRRLRLLTVADSLIFPIPQQRGRQG